MDKTSVLDLEKKIKNAGALASAVLDPDKPYKGNDVVVDAYKLNDTFGYANEILEQGGKGADPAPGLRRDFFENLIGPDLSSQFAPFFSRALVLDAANDVRKELEANAALFVRNHLNSCMSAIRDSKNAVPILTDMVLNAKGPFCKIRGDDEHNFVYERVMSKKELEDALKQSREGDRSKLLKLCKGMVKERKLAKWVSGAIENYLEHDPAFLELVSSVKYDEVARLAQATIVRSDGTVDVAKASDFVKGSYREMWRLHDEEVREGGKATGKAQSDTRKKVINPRGRELLMATANAEHPSYMKDVESAYGDRYRDEMSRAEDRQWAGMKPYVPDAQSEYGTAV